MTQFVAILVMVAGKILLFCQNQWHKPINGKSRYAEVCKRAGSRAEKKVVISGQVGLEHGCGARNVQERPPRLAVKRTGL